MSPRMEFMLETKAMCIYETLSMEIDDGYEWDAVRLRPDITRAFHADPSLWKSYAEVFKCIASCLASNGIPNSENVVSRASRNGPQRYLELGGTTGRNVKLVLRTLFKQPERQDSKVGYESFQEAFKEYKSLKKCRNDHEFDFVELHCGSVSHFQLRSENPLLKLYPSRMVIFLHFFRLLLLMSSLFYFL